MENDYIFLAVLAVLAVASWKITPRLIARVPFVDPGEVKRMLDAGEAEVVLDVRTEDQFNGKLGHIPGAVCLPFVLMPERLKGLESQMSQFKDEPVFVTCNTENVASHAARKLRKAGFAKVAVVRGGMRGWNRKGLPVERNG